MAGLVGAALDLLQTCILAGHGIILILATFYYAVSRKLRFMTQYPLICGLCFGAGVYLVMMLIVLPLSDIHRYDPFTIRGLRYGMLIHMVVFGLRAAE